MTNRIVGKRRIAIVTYVTPETYYAMEDARGILKRSTYCAMVLEEIFNPSKSGSSRFLEGEGTKW